MAMNFLGVGSGLDLQTMLNQLVEVATTPKVEQLGRKEVQISSSISGIGSLKSALSDFQDSVGALKSESLYGNNTASVTQPESGDVITVTSSSDAVPGSYDVSVTQLAQGSRLTSDNDLSAFSAGLGGGSAQLSFDAGAGNSFSITVEDGDTLEATVAKINSDEDNFGVSATIVDGKLIYKSSITGAGNSLVVSNDNAALDNLSSVPTGASAGFTNALGLDETAQDAIISVDGISISSDTNVFEGDVTGLTITAVKESEAAETAALTVGRDTQSIASAVNSMASAYNKVIEVIGEQQGSNDEEGNFVAGPMFGESILRQVESVLSNAMTSIAGDGSGSLNSMYSVGFDLQSDGTISVDNDRLASALTDNFDDFSSLFSGTTGFATQLYDNLDNYLEYGGIIDGAEESYESQMDDIEDQYAAHIEYIKSYKETLTKQFASLDSTIATLNATQSYVSGQLAQLSNISGG